MAFAGNRLPALAVAKQSYAYIWAQRRLLAMPLLMVFAAQFGYVFYARMDERSGHYGPAHGLFNFVLYIVILLFGMAVVVGLHRTVLLDETRRGLGFPRFDGNLRRYFGVVIGAFFLGGIAGIFLIFAINALAHTLGFWIIPAGAGRKSHLAVQAIWLAFVLCYLAFIRFMLALPGAAVGNPDPFGASYRATRGNWWRLLAVALLTGLPLFVLIAVSAAMDFDQIHDAMGTGKQVRLDHSTLFLIVSAGIRTFETAVLTVMLSLTYQHLVGTGRSADAAGI
jgi:hypothetical protein